MALRAQRVLPPMPSLNKKGAIKNAQRALSIAAAKQQS
jgi:hypothetical protein